MCLLYSIKQTEIRNGENAEKMPKCKKNHFKLFKYFILLDLIQPSVLYQYKTIRQMWQKGPISTK